MKNMRTFIFVNGNIDNYMTVQEAIDTNDLIVAVDGGYSHLKKLGIIPDVLIGDMDSISPEELTNLETQEVDIIRYPAEKDETDLELALDYVIRYGFDHIIIVAAFGGRLDQALTNLFLITDSRFKGKKIEFFDGTELVYIIDAQIEFTGKIGDRVSLIPVLGQADGIYTAGLKFQLDNETLFPEKSRGISNEIVSENVKITIKSGRLLCIHTQVKY